MFGEDDIEEEDPYIAALKAEAAATAAESERIKQEQERQVRVLAESPPHVPTLVLWCPGGRRCRS